MQFVVEGVVRGFGGRVEAHPPSSERASDLFERRPLGHRVDVVFQVLDVGQPVAPDPQLHEKVLRDVLPFGFVAAKAGREELDLGVIVAEDGVESLFVALAQGGQQDAVGFVRAHIRRIGDKLYSLI